MTPQIKLGERPPVGLGKHGGRFILLFNSDSVMMMTRQEKVVLDLLATGLSSRQIAEKLLISFHTVETHRKNLRVKFKAHNTTEVILKAYPEIQLS